MIGQLTAGGAEGQLLQLALALRNGRHRGVVYCLSGRDEPIGRQLRSIDVPVRVIDGPRTTRPAHLRRALVEDGIDLLHAWLYIGNSYAWLANRGLHLPLITSARNCKRQGVFHDLINALAFRHSERIIVNSDEVARYVERVYRAPSGRLAVVYNGIDVERFSPAGQRVSAPPRIVGMGRLVPQKDPFLFLEAASQLAARHDSVRFSFVGSGPLRDRLIAAVKERGLAERFEVPGETRDVPDVLRAATLFWLTSAWEGLPNVVLEAMASGVPVIATDVGGTRELVRSGREGFLIRHGDAEALVHYSHRLLSDESARRQLAANARGRAMEFSTSCMVESMQHIYEEVMTHSCPATIAGPST